MQIHDFHSKLTSRDEEGNLFQALRSLSLVEDLRSMIDADPANALIDWSPWPPMEASAAYAVQA
ncbi:MAG: hypothetical protein ACJ75H_03630 [Thermoanaerobaculia bacterium]